MSTRVLTAILSLLGTSLLALGCAAGVDTPTPTATLPPSPTATPWTLSAQETAAIDGNINSVIDIAKTRMAALGTAHFSVVRSAGSDINLEFDVRFPFEVQGVVTESGDPEELGLLLTMGKAFTGGPKGSCWTEMCTPGRFVNVYGVNVVSTIIQTQLDLVDSIRNLEQAPDETAEAFYHFRFDINWPMWFNVWVQGLDQTIGEQIVNQAYPQDFREAMLSGEGLGLQGTVYKGEVWIDKETLRVHRFLWKQIATEPGGANYTWAVTVSDFDQVVPTAPDLEDIARLGPCPDGT